MKLYLIDFIDQAELKDFGYKTNYVMKRTTDTEGKVLSEVPEGEILEIKLYRKLPTDISVSFIDQRNKIYQKRAVKIVSLNRTRSKKIRKLVEKLEGKKK